MTAFNDPHHLRGGLCHVDDVSSAHNLVGATRRNGRKKGKAKCRRYPRNIKVDEHQSLAGFTNICAKARPTEPLGVSMPSSVASVGATSFTVIFSSNSPALMPGPMKITGTCAS